MTLFEDAVLAIDWNSEQWKRGVDFLLNEQPNNEQLIFLWSKAHGAAREYLRTVNVDLEHPLRPNPDDQTELAFWPDK